MRELNEIELELISGGTIYSGSPQTPYVHYTQDLDEPDYSAPYICYVANW